MILFGYAKCDFCYSLLVGEGLVPSRWIFGGSPQEAPLRWVRSLPIAYRKEDYVSELFVLIKLRERLTLL